MQVSACRRPTAKFRSDTREADDVIRSRYDDDERSVTSDHVRYAAGRSERQSDSNPRAQPQDVPPTGRPI